MESRGSAGPGLDLSLGRPAQAAMGARAPCGSTPEVQGEPKSPVPSRSSPWTVVGGWDTGPDSR